ncbi:MAG: restriction endonuclease subunit S [Kiritimatiellia bacterium]
MHKNENRPGYKKTKVGWIPEGWDHARLEKFSTVKTGPFGAQLHESDYVENGTPIITVEHLSESGVLHKNLPLVSDEDKGRLSQYLLKSGDIVFSRVGSVDRNSLISESENGWLFSGRLLRVRPDLNKICPRYLSNYFHQHSFKHHMRSIAVGGTMACLNTNLLSRVPINIPPLAEQEAIAAVLECWDGGIGNLELRIVKKKRIKKVLMQRLLSGKSRLPGFSKPWNNVKLGEVLTEHKEESSGAEEVHSVSVHKGVINQVEHLGRSFAAKDTANYNLVKPGDIIYTKSPTGDFPYGIIKQSTLDKDVIVSPLYGVFTPMTIYLGVMLDAYFASPVNTGNYLRPIIQKGAKNTINITNSTFMSGKLNLPLDKKEQQAIAEVLTAADREIEALERKLALWKEQKKYLLNNLVTGTIRLPEFVKNSPQKST